MTTANTNVIAKVAAVIAGLGLVAMSFASTPAAHADAASDAQIAALMAQIAALQAQQSGSASVMFNVDLHMGSKGADVTALQNWLIKGGYSIPAGATGYFGGQTRAALAKYQAANGISPAVGYFGPITRAKVNASAGGSTTGGTTTGGTSTGGTLHGGEGSLNNFKVIGPTTTSLNASDSDTVFGFEFKATGSDLQVNRVDFDVVRTAQTGGNGSSRPWNVFKTATLMNGSKVVATLDASNVNNWSEDGTVGGVQQYRLRFDGLHDLVPQDSTVDYYLKLDTQNSISNSNAGGTYGVNLPSQGVRAIDAKGIQQYSSGTATAYNSVSVSNSTTGSLTLSAGTDNPSATTVMANTNSQTSDVSLLTFSLQAKDSNVNVYTIPVTFSTTSGATTTLASNLIRTFKLYQGSTLIDQESVAAGSASSFTFKNLHVQIPSNSTQNFSVKADINAVGGTSNNNEGASISLSIPNSGWDATNSAGDSITPTGSVTGNLMTFRSIGINATVSGSSVTGSGTNTTAASFSFTVPVTAFGQTVYVGSTTSAFTATIHTSTTTYNATGVITSGASIDSGSGAYYVTPGQTANFTITVSATGAMGSGLNYASLDNIKYGTAGNASTANTFTFPNNSNNRTNAILLN